MQKLIKECCNDPEKLKRAMGFDCKHNDITAPQMDTYTFQHFNFGMGDLSLQDEALFNSIKDAVKRQQPQHV